MTGERPNMSSAPETTPKPDPSHLFTSHSFFLRPSTSPSLPPTSLLLRGVNLSSTSKFPSFSGPSGQTHRPRAEGSSREDRDAQRSVSAGQQSHLGEDDVRFWSEAEEGGKDGWFVGHPFPEDDADVHLQRLKAWGFTTIRYILTWEALEHAGPYVYLTDITDCKVLICPSGKYDEAYIDYTIRILRKCREHGFRVFISPHQDVFSRFISGSGAPYWALVALGLQPRRLHQTGSAILHQCYSTQGMGGEEGLKAVVEGEIPEWPDMIWNTNLHRLAARHCFTMFFASEDFAPLCTIDGVPAGQWLRHRYNEAYGHLADRFRDAGDILDDCVIGWDSMNEPQEGFISIPDLNEFPEAQNFKKGPSPTPIQGFRLGVGQSVSDIEYGDFTSTGQKKKGTVTITPPGGKGVWLSRLEAREAEQRWGWKWGKEWDFWDMDGEGGCPWAGHGVWDRTTGKLLEPDYFVKAGKEPAEFIDDYWKGRYTSYISRIRKAHPNAISFINPPIFEAPPDLSETVKQGRMALSSHFYDGLTMLNKRRHVFNADAVGLQRGLTNMLSALKFGTSSIRSTLRDQLGELKSDAHNSDSMAAESDGGSYPTIIGELGTPFDMKKTKMFGLAKAELTLRQAMDQLLNACDGPNTLSFALWVYEPLNTHTHGDGWNGEDLSLLSYDEVSNDEDLLIDSPRDLSTLMTFGARAIESWCRPYPLETMGRVKEFSFDMGTAAFELVIHVDGLEDSQLWADQGAHGAGLDQNGTTGGSAATALDAPENVDKSKSGDQPISQGSTTIYLPYVHYLQNLADFTDRSVSDGKKAKGTRLLGEPSANGEEWIAGRGPARVELDLIQLSEGELKVEGQWGKWQYPLFRKGEREIRLKLKRWGA